MKKNEDLRLLMKQHGVTIREMARVIDSCDRTVYRLLNDDLNRETRENLIRIIESCSGKEHSGSGF